MLRVRPAFCLGATFALTGLLVGSVLVTTARGEFTPVPIPPIHIHLPKAQESAVFDVIVEGRASDELESHISGETGNGPGKAGTCLYLEDGTVTETTTYRRGKGLALQFDRYGKEAVVHRVNRETDSSLAVQLATKRTATGGDTFSPAYPNLPCTAEGTDLSKNPDCGQSIGGSGVAAFTYEDDRLGLAIEEKKKRRPTEFGTCGLDPTTGLTLDFTEAWPKPPKLQPALLRVSSIFGHQHTIKLDYRVSDVPRPAQAPKTREMVEGSLKASLSETASNQATVRLIRQNPG